MTISEDLEREHNIYLKELNGGLFDEYVPPLYHYTSLSSVKLILETKKLRFTDIRYLNDPGELISGLKIDDAITSMLIDEFIKKDIHYTRFLLHRKYLFHIITSFNSERDLVIDNYKKEAQDRLGDKIEDFPYREIKIFISCFSEHDDDLRQWIPYSDFGSGASIGTRELMEPDHVFCAANILKVCYESDAKKHKFLYDFLLKAYDFHSKVMTNPTLLEEFQNKLYELLIINLIACKSEKYKDEKEWRYLLAFNDEKEIQKIGFYEKDKLIKPYLDIPIYAQNLSKVKLGPRAETRLNKESIRQLLTLKGFTSDLVETSSITYR